MFKARGLIFLFYASIGISPLLFSQNFGDRYRAKTNFKIPVIEEEKLQDPKLPQAKETVISKTRFNAVRGRESESNNPFGDRAQHFGILKRDDKFVHLNPETAFGPEIIQSFDFPDTDILKLTKHMQKLTGINLILDKDVKGKVSISAPSAITVGDAWRAYLTALNMSGYALVPSGNNFYKIISLRNLRNSAPHIYTGGYTPDTDNFIMKVIPLKNISATEVRKAFRSFTTQNGRIIPMEQTNTVLIMDTGSNIARLMKLIKYLDVPGYDESLQIIKVRHSSAQEIAKLLDEILNKTGTNARRSNIGNRNNKKDISKIIAEPRTNSIIAMANADGAKQLKTLIAKLDVSYSSHNSGKIHVYYLQHGDAEDLSKTLSGLLSGAASTDAARNRSRFARQGGGESNQIFTSEVKVTADKNNNALVITASPTDWLTLQGVLKKLDIPKDQVMVEGMVVETEVKKGAALGVSYAGATGDGAFDRAGFNTNAIPVTEMLSNGFASLGGLFAGIGFGQKKEIDIGGKSYNVSSVTALLRAVASNQGNNVLATPKILVMDNKDAEFEVGSTVPITETTPGTGGSSPTQSIKNQKITLKFKITPQINKVTRFIKLKIQQQIDDIAANQNISEAVANNTGVQTNTRSAVTDIVVKDKDTVVMGGLLRDRETVSVSKVPLLGDIPVLGWLFKNKSRDITKTNILFFITPTIVSPYEPVAHEITEQSIRDREEFLKPVLEDDKLPFDKTISQLHEKVRRQKAQKLRGKTPPNIYQKSNMDAELELLNMKAPKYQEALDAMRE